MVFLRDRAKKKIDRWLDAFSRVARAICRVVTIKHDDGTTTCLGLFKCFYGFLETSPPPPPLLSNARRDDLIVWTGFLGNANF